MGWLFMSSGGLAPHRSPKAYLDAQLTYEPDSGTGRKGSRVVRSLCSGTRVYYAACQRYDANGAEPVFAVICLVRWNPRAIDGHVFGYKDLDETCGPHEAGCPASILELLGPTDHPYALDWRNRCHRALRRRSRSIEDGDRIRFLEPMSFVNGYHGAEFIVEKRGTRVRFCDPASGLRYRIPNFRDRAWEAAPRTKVQKTVFAKRVG